MPIEVEYTLAIVGAILLACFIAYLGFRSGVKSEQRKEFNELADPLRETVRNLDEHLTDPHIKPRWPDADEFNQLIDRAPFFGKKKLENAVNNYRNSIKNSCGYGDDGRFRITDEVDLRKSIAELLKSLVRK